MKKCYLILFSVSMLYFNALHSQGKLSQTTINPGGFIILQEDAASTLVSYHPGDIHYENIILDGKSWQYPCIPGVFLPGETGAPNLPGTGRYLAIPQGSEVSLEVVSIKKETVNGMQIAPAPRIPKETEDGLEYPFNREIYDADALYPEQTCRISEPTQIRGVDVVMMGVTPFQYNPVRKELTVIREIIFRIHHDGGSNKYGETRLRSRWFDPLLQDLLLNPSVLPPLEEHVVNPASEETGCEYLIIVPTDAFFTQWADSIKKFRTEQGINTMIRTLAQVGGNTPAILEAYINNAFNTWTIPPVAILLIGDYGSSTTNTITSPIWNSYCVSDNILGDVNGNNLPDIVMARMTAQNQAQLEVMVKKFLSYERTPPTSPYFYSHPITALGWQTERWFQVCSEVIGGFWANSLGKTPVRINAVYGGNPAVDPWSSATNTSTVINYFGPSGLGYIPATPQTLGGWTGGTAVQVNNALNAGSFMLQHRDHGYEQGWGEPSYSSTSISGLTNTDLSFIMSINCLTGKYNYASEVFSEKFHRYTYGGVPAGALGLLAASEISYSFVNDAFIWGVYDNMWPEFMPAYGSTPAHRGILPAFGNAAGKYFLAQSSWPYNTGNKVVTYHLFHHHGDAFMTVFSEVPQSLTVVHDPVIYAGLTTFTVTANAGALICLSSQGVILGTAIGTGNPIPITIPGTQVPPQMVRVVVTLQNYYRYTADIPVIPPAGPYVVQQSYTLQDPLGNGNGQFDYGEAVYLSLNMKNAGTTLASNVLVTLHTNDPYVTLTDSVENYGNIIAGGSVQISQAFSMTAAATIPDMHIVTLTVTATNGSATWNSYLQVVGHAPVLAYNNTQISDPLGNNNSKADPGETLNLVVHLANQGTAAAVGITAALSTSDPYITLITNNLSFGSISGGGAGSQPFAISISPTTPQGHTAQFSLSITAAGAQSVMASFTIIIGQIPVLVINLDGNGSAGPAIQSAIQANNISCDLQTSFPANLSLYSSIFVCLGIYSENHVLSSTEGQSLATYLSGGGMLYMEGGDTWAYDAQTAVHPLFSINGQADGSADLGTLLGQNNTFTAGMGFLYTGENSWIDRIGPASGSSAFTVLANQSPAYGSAVAFAGNNYKTIGASHEFAGLSNGTFPSTKQELMRQYLIFFGLINVNVHASFSADDSTIVTGTNVSFTDLSTGDPVSWSWAFAGGTPATSNLQHPVITYNTAGVFDVTLVVSNAFNASTFTRYAYIHVGSDSLTGILTYNNTASTPLSNSTIQLKSGTTLVGQTSTNPDGFYAFAGIAPGTYTIKGQCTKPWGGVNSTDALLIMRHFVGQAILSGIRLKGADVDGTGVVNAVDALATQRRSIGMIPSFPAGDWAVESPQLTFSGLSQQTQHLKSVCFGDVNGSYNPPLRVAPSVFLNSESVVTGRKETVVRMPLSVKEALIPGAVTLYLDLTGYPFVLQDVISLYDNQNLIWNKTGETLAISWYSLSPPSLLPGDELFTLSFLIPGNTPSGSPFSVQGIEGEVADIEGIPYESVSLSFPQLCGVDPEGLSVFPNPFSSETSISIYLFQAGPVNITIVDIQGRIIKTLTNSTLPSGLHTFTWKGMGDNGKGVENGVYFLRSITTYNTDCKTLIITK